MQLLYDIETTPNIIYAWDIWEVNALKVIKPKELLSVAYKIDKEDVKVFSQKDLTHKQVVKNLWELFDKADIIIGHNSKKFDTKSANTFFVKYGLKPPSPYKQIDTLQIAREKFRFNSNKLNDLGEYLNCGKKVDTGGFSLWEQCMSGNKEAWQKMEEYNKQDVVLLEKIYNKLSPWAENLPSTYAGYQCPNCGSNKIQWRGYNTNKNFRTRRFQCTLCGKWSTSNTKEKLLKEYIK